MTREREVTMSYDITRFYASDEPARTIARGLTLEQAQAHCKDPETSSSTATSDEATAHTRTYGLWFDGYEEENVEDKACRDRLALASHQLVIDKVEALLRPAREGLELDPPRSAHAAEKIDDALEAIDHLKGKRRRQARRAVESAPVWPRRREE
ncbi:MAG: hypothetical protein WKH68_12175 [Candidatus Limnocylindria bacterium]